MAAAAAAVCLVLAAIVGVVEPGTARAQATPVCTQPLVATPEEVLGSIALVEMPSPFVSAKTRSSSVQEGGPGPIVAVFEVTREIPLPPESHIFSVVAYFEEVGDPVRDGFRYGLGLEAGFLRELGSCIDASGAVGRVPAGTRFQATLTWDWFFNFPPTGPPVFVPWPANEAFTATLNLLVNWGSQNAAVSPFGAVTIVAGPQEGTDATDGDGDGIPDVVDPDPPPPPPDDQRLPTAAVGTGLVQPGGPRPLGLPGPYPPPGRLEVTVLWPGSPVPEATLQVVAVDAPGAVVDGLEIPITPDILSIEMAAPSTPGVYLVRIVDGTGRATQSNAFTVGRPWKWAETFMGLEPDYGIYWFRSGTDGLKAIAGQDDDYFRPERPTLIYVHGWQPGTTVSGDRESFALPDTFAAAWTDTGGPNLLRTTGWPATSQVAAWRSAGWNVGIFYWDVFADEPGAQDCISNAPLVLPAYGELPTLGVPCAAETKIWERTGRWRHGDGSYRSAAPSAALNKSAAELLRDEYVLHMAGSTAPEVRLAGHSLGSQLVVLGAWLIGLSPGGAPLPDRVALLDPYVSPVVRDGVPGGSRLALLMNSLGGAAGVEFEMYRTTNLPELSGTTSSSIADIKAEATVARLDLAYLEASLGQVAIPAHVSSAITELMAGCHLIPALRAQCRLLTAAIEQGARFVGQFHADGTNMHKAARYWYFLSFATPVGECIALPLLGLCLPTGGAAPGASAALSALPPDSCWVQIGGAATPSLVDDRFERRSAASPDACESLLDPGAGVHAFATAWNAVQRIMQR